MGVTLNSVPIFSLCQAVSFALDKLVQLFIAAFVNAQHYRTIVTPLVCALLLLGCLPAALAMFKNKDEEGEMYVGEPI